MPSTRSPVNRAIAGVLAAGLLVQAAAAAAGSGFAELVRRVAPAVVTVLVEEQPESAGQRAVDRATAEADPLRGPDQRMAGAPGGGIEPTDGVFVLGSGFVIDPDGVIVTNRHVIVGARSVRVKLADGRRVDAQVIGMDAATDIALLKVTAGRLPSLRLGSSERISVGDPVIAIGNPFGLGQSVTSGILSARGRNLETDPYIDFLQTDAAINHGNSGGPLLSADGTVVGVTSAILSPSGGSVGLGFAIPAETVASIITELQAHGHVDRGYLGVAAQPMTPALAVALGSPAGDQGVLVSAVEPTGPAFGALFAGDILLRINGTPVSFDDLAKFTARLRPGASAEVGVLRAGAEQTTSVVVGQLPDPPADAAHTGEPDTWVPNLGMAVANTTAPIRLALKAQESGGLIVTQLRPTGPGAIAHLRIGDLITHAGAKRLMDVGDLVGVAAPSPQAPLLLRVVRGGSPNFVAVTGRDEP